MKPKCHSMHRQNARHFFRRGASLGRTLILSVAILLGVATAHRMAVSWVIETALENSKEAITECTEFPARETPLYLDTSILQSTGGMPLQEVEQFEASEVLEFSEE